MSSPKPTIDSLQISDSRFRDDAESAAPRAVGAPGDIGRIRRALKEEFKDLSLRQMCIDMLVCLIPNRGFSRIRTALYRLGGVDIGAHALVFGRIQFTGSPPDLTRFKIGAHTMINVECFVDLNADVQIGNCVGIGHHVTFITAEHEIGPSTCRAGVMQARPIVIEDGCWIGAGCTILPGVRIGRASVVTAGSLVSGDVPPNRLVGGVPARAIRTLPSEP